jgi:TRAP-type mannitol/chloroaromatic compound transport system permease small subunit
MKATLQWSLKTIDMLSTNTGKLFSFLVVFIMILEVYEAIMRYIFGSPTIWSWELAMLFYGVHFMLGGAWVLQQNKHVRTDVLLLRFPKRMQSLFEVIFFGTVFMVFAWVMSTKQIENAIYSINMREKTYTEWAPAFYPVKIAIAISFILLSLQGIARWIRSFYFLITGKEID